MTLKEKLILSMDWDKMINQLNHNKDIIKSQEIKKEHYLINVCQYFKRQA